MDSGPSWVEMCRQTTPLPGVLQRRVKKTEVPWYRMPAEFMRDAAIKGSQASPLIPQLILVTAAARARNLVKRELISQGTVGSLKESDTSALPGRQWMLAPACLRVVTAPRKGITEPVCSNAPHCSAPLWSTLSPATFPVSIKRDYSCLGGGTEAKSPAGGRQQHPGME